ncbi:MAG TPA: TonB-dependent receptor [Cyclobacteriaceae bacterium]|nr:TonB-dependent receptor [Cyclobacteriaceae bacterium]
MKSLLTVLIVHFLGFHVFGQSYSVSGLVKEAETETPVSFCNIVLINSMIGTTSDVNGYFEIVIPDGVFRPRLALSFVGYITDTLEVVPTKNKYVIYLKPSQQTLDEVVVTGVSRATTIKQNPISISMVSSRTIERTLESNIIDVLVKNTPGLNAVKTGPNISKPFIRGLGYNRVLTLYDGLRQEGQQWGDEHGIEVDAYNVERAEVIKGPASLMYGSDALAGVVSMFSYVPKEEDGQWKGRFLSEYQSNNGLIGNALRLSTSKRRWHATVNGSLRMAKNYTNSIDGSVYNTGFEEKNASAMAGYKSSKGDSHLTLTLYDNFQGIPDGSRDSLSRRFTKQIYEGSADDIKNRPFVSNDELNSYKLSPLHQHIQHYRIYSNNHYQIGKGDIDATVGFQQNIRREYNHPTAPEQAGLFVRLNTINYGLRYNFPEFSNTEISVGLNGMFQDNKNKDATDFPIPDFNLLDVGSYTFAKWKKNRWTVSGGVRYDIRHVTSKDFYIRQNPSTGFDQQVQFPDTTQATLQFPALDQLFKGISLSLGSTFNLNEHWSVKANFSRGYRAPNIAEIASNGLDPGAHIVYIGNRNFVPEFNFQQDVGIDANFKTVSASLSIFNNEVQHYIYLDQLADAQGNPIQLVQGNKTFQYQQASAHLYGMEASVDFRTPWIEGFDLSSNLSAVIGNNTKSAYQDKGVDGQYLPFIPPLKILSTITQELKIKSRAIPTLMLKADVDYNAAQNRYLALYQTETRTPSYTLVNTTLGLDARLSKEFSMQIQFQINNLFNAVYQSNLSRLKYFEYYSQSPNGNLGMYGMGRNVGVRVIVRF